jgi:hypothetical protein
MKSVAASVAATLAVASPVFGAGGLGCAVDATDEENVGSTSEALTRQDYVDSTGRVFIRVKTCDWSPTAQHPAAVCVVDNGYVLVGGGAEVEGQANGGGLLTRSFPPNKVAWFASSKDHVTAHSHRIRAYVVGMQLAGVSQATLDSLVTISSATSGASHAPSVTVAAPAFYTLLSGGASSNASGAGQLLTGSFPPNSTSWTASAKDHQQSDIASVTAYAVSIPICLNGQWNHCLFTQIDSNSTSVPGGYGVATVNTPAGFAPVGVGGRARWGGAGRLLTDIFPTNSVGNKGATAFSKDHNLPEGNTTDVWALSIQSF